MPHEAGNDFVALAAVETNLRQSGCSTAGDALPSASLSALRETLMCTLRRRLSYGELAFAEARFGEAEFGAAEFGFRTDISISRQVGHSI
jgi:hypothetical protein